MKKKYLISSRLDHGSFKTLKVFSLFNLKSYLIILSHDWADNGIAVCKIKYKAVKICPSPSYGYSTGRPPIHVNRIVSAASNQNIICAKG